MKTEMINYQENRKQITIVKEVVMVVQTPEIKFEKPFSLKGFKFVEEASGIGSHMPGTAIITLKSDYVFFSGVWGGIRNKDERFHMLRASEHFGNLTKDVEIGNTLLNTDHFSFSMRNGKEDITKEIWNRYTIYLLGLEMEQGEWTMNKSKSNE